MLSKKKENEDDRTPIQVPCFPIPAKSGIRGNFEWGFKLIGERVREFPALEIGSHWQGEWESIRDFAAAGPGRV